MGCKMVEMEAMTSEALRPKIKRRSGVSSLSAEISIITMRVKDAMNDMDPDTIGITASVHIWSSDSMVCLSQLNTGWCF